MGIHKKTIILQEHIKNMGFNPNDINIWKNKHKMLKVNAEAKGAECLLTFDEFMLLAKEAGLFDPKLIGCHNNDYCLGRVGDKGKYEIGNCRFIPVSQNQAERKSNGGAKSQASKLLGRNKNNDSSYESVSLKASKSFRLVSPTGEIHEGTNLLEFCQNMGLSKHSMWFICRNPGKTSKGWTGTYL